MIRAAKAHGKTIGLVPTLGALHEGHLSLIRKARRETRFVVVSIFVNPIQFDRKADFRSYPRTLRADAAKADEAGAHLLFVPKARDLYPSDFQTFVEVTKLSRLLEGIHRPGHFRGVATIVTKLFNLVEPDIAYFGRKDAQQARMVEQLIRDLNFHVRLRICPTVREPQGLAASSRNRLLSRQDRQGASRIFDALQQARRLIQCGQRQGKVVSRRVRTILRSIPHATVDYVAVVDPETLRDVPIVRGRAWLLVAVWIGKVRLIDGCVIG